MQKTIAAIVTFVLAIGLAIIGVTAGATGSGCNVQTGVSDSCVLPYTVSGTGLQLPSGSTFADGGHVNIEYTVNGGAVQSAGVHFDLTNDPTGTGQFVGHSVLPWSYLISAPSYCITWVQVAGYNEHFGEGGQAPICNSTPTLNASAVIAKVAATCNSGETLDLTGVDHASFGPVTYGPTQPDGSRTYQVTATAQSTYTFPSNGLNTLPFSGTLAGPLTTGCGTHPACVQSPTYVYTFNSSTAGGVITVSAAGAHTGDALCTPLYVRSATWNYNLPTDGNNPSWPQTLVGKQDVTVNAIGSFSYQAPGVTGTCQQKDIYATFSANGFSDLALPTTLTGSHAPYEPAFLHETLSGKGPNPTYSTDVSAGCTAIRPVATLAAGACYWDSGQQASFKTATLVYDNSASNVPVAFVVTSYPASHIDNSGYNRTVAAGATVSVPLPPSRASGVTYEVTAGGVVSELSIPVYAECPPTVQPCTAVGGPVLSTNLVPNGWTFTETRSKGHNEYVSGALHISTDGSTDVVGGVNQDQAAGYYTPTTPIALSQFGTPSIDYTSTSGSSPVIALVIDQDGNGTADTTLTYQSPSTLNDFLKQHPAAVVTSFGYLLGPAAQGDGMIKSVTAGCMKYSFDYATVPTDAPAVVSFNDVCGTASDTVLIPTVGSADKYTYVEVDQRVGGVGNVTVTAVPKSGFAFAPGVTTSWSHDFLSDADNKCATIQGDPAASPASCNVFNPTVLNSGYITVTQAAHVTYTIHNTDVPSRASDVTGVVSGRTDLPVGHYSVTAIPDTGWTLTNNPATTPLEITQVLTNCQLIPHAALTNAAAGSGQVCSNGKAVSGYITVDLGDGLDYFIGSTQLTANKTAMAPGTYSVRAVAIDPLDVVLAPNPVTVVIQALGASCPPVKTLAFTGGAGPNAVLLGSAVLFLLGGLLLLTNKRRRPRHIE